MNIRGEGGAKSNIYVWGGPIYAKISIRLMGVSHAKILTKPLLDPSIISGNHKNLKVIKYFYVLGRTTYTKIPITLRVFPHAKIAT